MSSQVYWLALYRILSSPHNPVFLQGSRDNSTERRLTSIGNTKSTRKSFGGKEINKKTIHNGF